MVGFRQGAFNSFGSAVANAPTNQNAAIVGDSLVAFGTSSVYWINGLLGGKLKLIGSAGVSSETTQDVLDRINNAYTDALPGLGGLSLGWCFLRIGTNDSRNGTSIATLGPIYDDLIAAILTHADFLVIQAVPPRKAGTTTVISTDYNNYLAAACAADPAHLLFVDDSSNLQSGGALIEKYFVAEAGPQWIHLSSAGVIKQGQQGATNSTLISMLGSYTTPVSDDAADVYPAQPQWVTNHVNAGTSGTKSGGVTGTVPNNWSIVGSGSVAATASIVSADGGDSNQTPWIDLEVTTGSSSGGAGFVVKSVLSGRTITTTDPASCDAITEFQFIDFDGTKAGDFTMYAMHEANGQKLCPNSTLLCLGFDDALINGTSVLRSALPRNNANAQSATTFFIEFDTAAFTGSSGHVRMRCSTVTG